MEVVVHPVEFEIKKAELLTDEKISVLWHEAQEQPFKFARLIERKLNESNAR